MVPQRRVFRVCASKLASDENLGHQHMRVVYHLGRSQIASISESHGGDLTIQRYDRSGWRVGLLQCSHSFKGADKSEDKADGVEASVERGKEATTSPEGLNYLKSKVSIRKEVDSEEPHGAVEANLPIAKEGMQMQGNG
ncbi:hypothetical protein BHE74_00047287 [Ensete ventricosum]|nr:hypothetical protein BHE74_00047287 [Ensete ventricosum]